MQNKELPWRQRHFGDIKMKRKKRAHNALGKQELIIMSKKKVIKSIQTQSQSQNFYCGPHSFKTCTKHTWRLACEGEFTVSTGSCVCVEIDRNAESHGSYQSFVLCHALPCMRLGSVMMNDQPPPPPSRNQIWRPHDVVENRSKICLFSSLSKWVWALHGSYMHGQDHAQ